jgi:hypothetical protein
MEMLDIAEYKKGLALEYPDVPFRKAVVEDFTRRRDTYCPMDGNSEFGIRSVLRPP